MQWHEVGPSDNIVNGRTSDMSVARRHRPNSQQQLHEVANAHRPTHLPFETMHNGDNYLKDGLLMQPERPWIDSLLAPCRPTRANNIETRASIPCQSQRSHQTPLKLFDVYFARSTASLFKLRTMWVAGKTGRTLTPALCAITEECGS